MKMNGFFPATLAIVVLAAASLSTSGQTMGTVFTYQGRLVDGGSPANGAYDFEFRLYNMLNGQVGGAVAVEDVPVVNGLFTVELDFGAGVFTGDARFLEAGVRPGPSTDVYTILSPKQELTPTPYALYALNGGGSLWSEGQWGRIYYGGGPVSIGTSSSSGRLYVFAEDEPGLIVSATGAEASGIEVSNDSPEYSALVATARGADAVAVKANARIDTQVAIEASATGTATLNNYPLPNTAGKFYASGTGSVGVYGHVNEGQYGVHGRNDHSLGSGVFGEATASGQNNGVYGTTASTNGRGVYGYAPATTGATRGVYGRTESTGGVGVSGLASASTGTAAGVVGQTYSPDGYAGKFFGGRNYFEGNVGIGETNPIAKLHLGGTPGADGIMFPDGTLQTTAALGGGGGGDGHSLDAADGNPVDALSVDNNGAVAVLSDLTVGDELIAEGEITLNDPNSGTDLASLNRNGDGHGRLVTFADGSSVASAVVGTDSDANGAGGLVLLSFDDALGPAVKLDSTGNAGRATLARSTGPLSLDETVVMYANAPEVYQPSTASGGGGIDLLNNSGSRSLAIRGAGLGVGASIKGFDPSGGTVFSLETGTSAPSLELGNGSGTKSNQVELAVGTNGGLLGVYNSAGVLTVGIDGEDSSDGAGRVSTQKLMITGGDLMMKDQSGMESVHLYADNPLGTHDGASLYLRDGTNDEVELHANYNGTGFSRVVTDYIDIGRSGYFGGEVGIGTQTPTAMLDVAGTARVDVLQIDGGADLSESFAVDGGAKPGMVVVIDSDRPGALRVSSTAYDRRVAGILSGAGGISTGMLMGQIGSVADGDHPVALTGRVYCWCDATNGAIKPGDMLTTSSTLGHAMKVTDYERAQGAVIGKAMSSLSEGTGLVLILVSLQ